MSSSENSANNYAIDPVSLRVERRFFSVTRWAVLIGAAFAIAITVIVLCIVGWQMTRSVDDAISPAVPKYSEFKDSVEKSKGEVSKKNSDDKELKNKEIAAAKAQADLEFEKKLQPYIDRIYKGLSTYAETVREASPNRDGLRTYVKNNMDAIISNMPDKADLPWEYAEGMARSSTDLAGDAARIATLAESDPARVSIDNFVTWYSKKFFSNLSAEQKRIQLEEAQVARGKGEAATQLVVAGITFGIFAALTILLVLLRIERNTRPRAV